MMRQKIAEHMVASKHVSPHVYSVDEIDMSKVAAIRTKAKEEFEKRYETKLTFMPFFVKAAVSRAARLSDAERFARRHQRGAAQGNQRRASRWLSTGD